jgi:hypothetical protein
MMKALLILMILPSSDGGHSTITPMPTMEGCRAAAVQIAQRRDDLNVKTRWIQALCVENR